MTHEMNSHFTLKTPYALPLSSNRQSPLRLTIQSMGASVGIKCSHGQDRDRSQIDGNPDPRQFLNLPERLDDGRLDVRDLLTVRIAHAGRREGKLACSQWLYQGNRTGRSIQWRCRQRTTGMGGRSVQVPLLLRVSALAETDLDTMNRPHRVFSCCQWHGINFLWGRT